jgi:hypothetical protein
MAVGLAASMRLAELGVDVDLMSLVPVKRSHSVCAQGGINSVNALTRQQGDNEWKHLDDTVYGGDFLQHQPPVKEMADWGPRIVDLMDRLGVPFNRTPEGFRDQRRFGGTLYKRTAFAGATTGQQLLYSLDEQVRRWEVEGKVKKWEFWDFLEPVLDDSGRCRGAICQDLVTMQFRAFQADAVVLAAGSWASLVPGVPASMPKVVPARGQIVELEERPVKAKKIVFHGTGYVVPRGDGRVLCGSTLEHVGYEKDVTAKGVVSILSAAMSAVPSSGPSVYPAAEEGKVAPKFNSPRVMTALRFTVCAPASAPLRLATSPIALGKPVPPQLAESVQL